MPDNRRYYIPNAIVFITCVARERIPYFHDESNVQLLLETMRRVQAIHPFRLLAYVILPDHFHWLMRVDSNCDTFSTVLHSVKRNYTLNHKHTHQIRSTLNLWQDRFLDHVIRDEQDFKNHFDYIHWNPVKHGYVAHPEDWRHSTYQHWLDRGYYEVGWGYADEPINTCKLNLE